MLNSSAMLYRASYIRLAKKKNLSQKEVNNLLLNILGLCAPHVAQYLRATRGFAVDAVYAL